MAESARLTDAGIRKYKPNGERRRIRDTQTESFYLIIEPSGHRSFQMRFRRPGGPPGKLTLGGYDESARELEGTPIVGQPLTLAAARALAADIHRRRALGEDVIGDHKAKRRRARADIEEKAATTFAKCVRDYIIEHARPRRRTWIETARVLGLDPDNDLALLPGGLSERWADRPVGAINSHDVWEALDEARRHGFPGLKVQRRGLSDVRARRLHAALSSLYGWLLRHRRVTANPCAGLGRAFPVPKARERALSPDEIRWLWAAAGKLGEPFGTIVKLLLLTGQRRDEVGGIRRAELDADLSLLSLPSTRTKNGRPHAVPLVGTAQALLAEAAARSNHEIIFSTTGHSAPSGFSRVKRRLDAEMLKIARAERGADYVIPPFTLHDLRRTAVTGLGDLGVRGEVIELLVNHAGGFRSSIAGTYNRSELMPERREALERWGNHVAGLLTPHDGKVVELAARRT